MKSITKTIIASCVGMIIFVSITFGAIYLCSHPNVRDISHFDDDNYYMVDVIVGSRDTESSHFGAVTKEDYNRWVNQESGTIWVVSSKDEDRGWRINISSITMITVYKRDWMPLNF